MRIVQRLTYAALAVLLAVGFCFGSVTQVNGWTVVTPTTGGTGHDSVHYYCSWTLGDDTYDGRYPDHGGGGIQGPKKTPRAMFALAAAGQPNWFHFLCTDTWTNQSIGAGGSAYFTDNGSFSGNPLSGWSAQEPCVVTTYGADRRTYPRPTISNASDVFLTPDVVPGTPLPLRYVCFIGLKLNSNGGTASIHIKGACDTILIEDCELYGGQYGAFFESAGFGWTKQRVTIRRSILRDVTIADSTNVWGSHAAGISLEDAHTFLIEENYLDSINVASNNAGHPEYDDAIYTDYRSDGGTVKRNTMSRCGDHGLDLVGSAVVLDNITIQSPGGNMIGGEQSITSFATPAITVDVEGNLLIEGINYRATSNAAGRGWTIRNVASGLFKKNIVTQSAASGAFIATGILGPYSIFLDGNYGTVHPVANLQLTQNTFYAWAAGARFNGTSGNPGTIESIIWDHNDEQEGALTTHPLMNGFSSSTFSEVTGSFNRYWRGGSEPWCYSGNGGANSTATIMTAMGDTTSTHAGSVTYADPTRTLGSYQASIGLTATTVAFITACKLQSKARWYTQYETPTVLRYFRNGFI